MLIKSSLPDQIESFPDQQNLPYKRNTKLIPRGGNFVTKESIGYDEKISPIVLRPDFEVQHEDLFRDALSLYHRLQFTASSNIVEDCIRTADSNYLHSGLSSFKLV